jgi:photosystem II stability/assembly factor-like uncharacterized protein
LTIAADTFILLPELWGVPKMKFNSKNSIFFSRLHLEDLRTKFLLVFCFILIMRVVANAQWIQTNGPYGGCNATYFINSGNTLFIGTYVGDIYYSTDNGTNWTKVSTSVPNKEITCFAASELNLYVGNSAGVFRSTNNGTSWDSVYNNTLKTSIYGLAAIGMDIFIGAGAGVLHSTDNGTSWNISNTGLNSTVVSQLIVSDTNLFAGTGSGIYLSTDKGKNWIEANNGLKYLPNTIFTFGTNLYVGTGEGLYRSTDNGTIWTSENTGLTNTNVHSFCSYGNNLFAATDSGVFRSTDNGSSWILASTGLSKPYSREPINCLGSSNTSIFACTNGVGIYRSTDDGITWTPVNSGILNSVIYSMAVSGSNLYAGSYNSMIFRTSNSGVNWIGSQVYATGDEITAIAISGSNLFAGTYFGGVFRSTDNGLSWNAVNQGLPLNFGNFPTISCFAVSDTNIFAGTQENGIYLSTNFGNSWNAINSGLTDSVSKMTSNNISDLKVSGKKIFAATNGGVYLTTNNGTKWTAIGPYYNISALATNTDSKGNTEIFAIADIYTWDQSLYMETSETFLSTNDGATWSEAFPGITFASFVISNGNFFISTYSSVLLSTNNGTTWTTVNTGFPGNISGISLAINETNLFAGTYGTGVWRRPLSEMITDVRNYKNNLPISFSLQQNYPNPFNPTTTINYSFPNSGLVIIKIYDVLGREVKTLINENKPAGNYSVQFNASKLVSGVYFYRMQAGEFVQTKKLLLLK